MQILVVIHCAFYWTCQTDGCNIHWRALRQSSFSGANLQRSRIECNNKQYVYKLMINHFISQFSFDSVTAAKPDQEMQLKQDNSVTILFTSINKCLRLWRMEFSSHFGNLCVISPMVLVKMIIYCSKTSLPATYLFIPIPFKDLRDVGGGVS